MPLYFRPGFDHEASMSPEILCNAYKTQKEEGEDVPDFLVKEVKYFMRGQYSLCFNPCVEKPLDGYSLVVT